MKFLDSQFKKVETAHCHWPILPSTLKKDLQAKSVWYYGESGQVFRMLVSDGSLCMVLFRLMRAFRRWHLGPLAGLVYKLNAFVTGAVIGRDAQFGPGLVILHSIGVVINSSVEGGNNVVIENGVTIGAEKGKSPILGDNIFIGAGAKILGAVKIGDNARIGANAVVIKDIPEGATAAGVPAEIVRVRED